MSKPIRDNLQVRGTSIRGKLKLGSNRLLEETLRITPRQKERVQAYQQQHDGKKLSDAWRDVINAGLERLGVPYMTIAGGTAPTAAAAPTTAPVLLKAA